MTPTPDGIVLMRGLHRFGLMDQLGDLHIIVQCALSYYFLQITLELIFFSFLTLVLGFLTPKVSIFLLNSIVFRYCAKRQIDTRIVFTTGHSNCRFFSFAEMAFFSDPLFRFCIYD